MDETMTKKTYNLTVKADTSIIELLMIVSYTPDDLMKVVLLLL